MKPGRCVSLISLLVAGCTDAAGSDPAAAQGLTAIDCALGGSGAFEEGCTMQRVSVDGQDELVVRHPDGGFRRFELGVPGRGLITAAGADQAEVTNRDGVVEVRVGADRYRLPVSE